MKLEIRKKKDLDGSQFYSVYRDDEFVPGSIRIIQKENPDDALNEVLKIFNAIKAEPVPAVEEIIYAEEI